MKFGHHFEEALHSDTFPKHWVDSAVPYGQLKKVLSKVRQELAREGYDPVTLRHLLENREAEYRLDAVDAERPRLRPRLTVHIRVVNHVPVDATLSPATLATLRELASLPAGPSAARGPSQLLPPSGGCPEFAPAASGASGFRRTEDAQDPQWIEVPLAADSTFFNIVQTDVNKLDSLQREEQCSMNTEVVHLGREVAEVSRPAKFSKTDLYRWREIFDLYLGAQVFFSTQEDSHGSRDSAKAQRQLVWFQTEVRKRGLPAKFKLASSADAFARFLTLNAKLLQSLQFQELNQRALTKIIKKFDKKTSLGVKQTFPVVVNSVNFMTESVAKAICAQLSQEVVSLVPQVEDYLCPVCFGICWVPVRLQCHHLFCIRCIVKMQSESKTRCPLCRADSVLAADCENLDPKLEAFMKRWFPKEVSEKQLSNDIERGKELFGPDYKYHRCAVM